MKYSWKGPKDRNRHTNRIERSGQARLVYVTDTNSNIPTTWRWARGDERERIFNINFFFEIKEVPLDMFMPTKCTITLIWSGVTKTTRPKYCALRISGFSNTLKLNSILPFGFFDLLHIWQRNTQIFAASHLSPRGLSGSSRFCPVN